VNYFSTVFGEFHVFTIIILADSRYKPRSVHSVHALINLKLRSCGEISSCRVRVALVTVGSQQSFDRQNKTSSRRIH